MKRSNRALVALSGAAVLASATACGSGNGPKPDHDDHSPSPSASRDVNASNVGLGDFRGWSRYGTSPWRKTNVSVDRGGNVMLRADGATARAGEGTGSPLPPPPDDGKVLRLQTAFAVPQLQDGDRAEIRIVPNGSNRGEDQYAIAVTIDGGPIEVGADARKAMTTAAVRSPGDIDDVPHKGKRVAIDQGKVHRLVVDRDAEHLTVTVDGTKLLDVHDKVPSGGGWIEMSVAGDAKDRPRNELVVGCDDFRYALAGKSDPVPAKDSLPSECKVGFEPAFGRGLTD